MVQDKCLHKLCTHFIILNVYLCIAFSDYHNLTGCGGVMKLVDVIYHIKF
jgi:hypothetical protein